MAEGLFVATNFLETCQGWQEVIDAEADPQARLVAAQLACDALAGQHDFRGATKVIVGSEAALMMRDGMSTDEAIWPYLQFGALRLRGNLGRAQYVAFGQNGSLSWMLTGADVLDPPAEVELSAEDGMSEMSFDYYLPHDRPVRRPLYLPVNLIDYALCAN